MTTRGKKKKQEQMRNSNQHKNQENLNQHKIQENLDEKFSFQPLVKKPRGRPRKQIYENELPEINMQKGSRTKVKSDFDSDPDSDPEYLDYLKEIQAKNKRNKNVKKP